MKVIEGGIAASNKKFAIVVSRFNHFVVDSLLNGAVNTLKQYGEVADDAITVVKVPCAYEVPVTVKKLAASGDYDAIIAVGAVIRGSTPHFDFVAGESSSGLAAVALEFGLP